MSSLESLPQTVSIEFPCRVNDHEKALERIGGASSIASAVKDPERKLELRLRDDDFHHPINSSRSRSNGLVLQLEVPTWALEKAGGNIQKALSLSKGNYNAKPLLFVSAQYKFREMADFQYNTQGNPILKKLDAIKTGNLAEIMEFRISDETPTQLLPPPRFSQVPYPLFYNYKQPSSVAFVRNPDGELTMVNKSKASQLKSHVVRWDQPVPTGPRDDLDPNPRALTKQCIEELKKLFEVRPSYTRRALSTLISANCRRAVRYALPYVAYFYNSGPWRAAYFRYGEDPTKNPEMAKFQIEHFRFAAQEEEVGPDETIYTFDGVKAPTTCMLQLCDITEPFMWQLIATSERTDELDERDGWFDANDMRAIRRVLRVQLEIVRDEREPLGPERLQEIAQDARNKRGGFEDDIPEPDEEYEDEPEEEED